jgi:hypothetical protein
MKSAKWFPSPGVQDYIATMNTMQHVASLTLLAAGLIRAASAAPNVVAESTGGQEARRGITIES